MSDVFEADKHTGLTARLSVAFLLPATSSCSSKLSASRHDYASWELMMATGSSRHSIAQRTWNVSNAPFLTDEPRDP